MDDVSDRSRLRDRRNREVSAQFVQNMRILRRRFNLTAEGLAEQVSARGYHIGRTSLGALETGTSVIVPLDLAVPVAQVLGVSLAGMLEPLCEQCQGAPPAGFACRACGAEA